MKLLIPISFSVFLAACGGGAEQHRQAAPAAAPVAVRTVLAASADWPETYEATGAVRARSSAILSSKVMAYVQQVSVAIGDRVRSGQTLVTLDSRDLETNVRRAEAARTEAQNAMAEGDNGIAAAKASLDLAQATFRRIDELASKESVSPHELDEATARLKSAQAAYEAARARRTQLDSRLAQVDQKIRSASIMRDYARITAPFDGIVTAKSVDPGVLATPGAPLLIIERDGGYRLEVSVDESRVPSVPPGETVAVALDTIDRAVNARVSEVVPAVDAASRTYVVKIDLPALPNVRSGVFGRAAFPLASRRVLGIPADALIERGQLQEVFVVEDQQVRLRLITAGRRAGNQLEVLSGLTAGEKLIAPVPAGLADGARVEVRP
ncbi:MAG TPA: efflux RND transporter periplasmic adaptor subunit [Candidatus Limnocylindrales bacterium]|nr:efflux RND transporter periplasmic adaptor subunit [Candidatus Limnocylindrales bacterium]